MLEWLRIRLPMQETQVQSLVWEDPTALEQLSSQATPTEALALKSPCSATREATATRNPRTTTEQPLHITATEGPHSNKDPAQPKLNT